VKGLTFRQAVTATAAARMARAVADGLAHNRATWRDAYVLACDDIAGLVVQAAKDRNDATYIALHDDDLGLVDERMTKAIDVMHHARAMLHRAEEALAAYTSVYMAATDKARRARDAYRVAAETAGRRSDYTELHEVIDAVSRLLGLPDDE
jgi:hypothetical protein